MMNRRHFMIGSLGTTLMLKGVSSAQSKIRKRQDIMTLTPDDPIIKTYIRAVRDMKLKPDGDRLSWKSQASIHQLSCPHGGWLFLPWHRAYLYSFEEVIRTITGNDEFALPYWDWTKDPKLPPVFLTPDLLPSKDPSAFDPTKDPKDPSAYDPSKDRYKRNANFEVPSRYVGRAVIDDYFQISEFEKFASYSPQLEDTTNGKKIVHIELESKPIDLKTMNRLVQTDTLQINKVTLAIDIDGKKVDPKNIQISKEKGTFEGLSHDMVHYYVGGAMKRTNSAALDPIFWLHHANVDRMWESWNRYHNNIDLPEWKNQEFANRFYSRAGAGLSKVADVLDAPRLGYTYDRLEVPSPAIAALLTKPSSKPSVSTRKVGTAPTRIRLKGSAAKTISFSIDTNHLPSLRKLSAVFNISDPGPGAENKIVHVFVDCDYLNPGVPLSDPHFAGSFTFFGAEHSHGTHDGAKVALKVAIDLDAAIGKMQNQIAGNLNLNLITGGDAQLANNDVSLGGVDLIRAELV